MIRPAFALVVGALAIGFTTLASAEPILKPHKYYGPIPQSGLTLRFGLFGGASNEEMINFLDGQLQEPFFGTTSDFGDALAVEVGYMYKPHPRFGVRVNAALSFLRSDGDGLYVPQTTDSIQPAVEFTREFNVNLWVLEASGVYFFSDASVKEFQPYLGGGFSVGVPHEVFKENRTDQDTGEPFGDPIELSETSVSAGVHAVLGTLFYFTNTVGISAEGRVQLMEGRFDKLEALNEVNEFEQVSFVVDYTGFYATIGLVWAF